ncbi:MAG: HAMP domain-containing sensor histidine kinase [Gemmatimonadota bacterium]
MPDALHTDILRRWEERCADSREGGDPPLPDLRDRVRRLVEGLDRWLSTDQGEPDHAVRDAFRDVIRLFRTRGVPTWEALRRMTLLEDVVGESDLIGSTDGPPTSKGDRLRLGIRGMLLDAVQVNAELDARFSRERADALAFFSEVLAHEMGNRLGAAQTAAELLRWEEVEVSPERRDALLKLVADGVESALTTVEDVTALMSAQARGEGEEVPLSRIVRGVVRTVSPLARKEGVHLEVGDDVPDAPVDGARMRLILTNLTLNGIRYSDPEKADRRVRIQSRVTDGCVRIKVSDNGIGIAAEERGTIFEYRERGTAGKEHTDGGSGLGLAVVAEAVSQLGGELALDSEVGEGSTFFFSAPIDPSDRRKGQRSNDLG